MIDSIHVFLKSSLFSHLSKSFSRQTSTISTVACRLVLLLMQLTMAVATFPRILTTTHNQTFNLSSIATLTCHVLDLDDHHVTWFKLDPSTSLSSPLAVGKQLFTTDKRYSVSFYSTSARDSFWSLEIYQIQLADEGTYTCQIANRRASVSVAIHLHVQVPMRLSPAFTLVEPGTRIQVNCTILVNQPANRSISWHFLSSDANRSRLNDLHIRRTFADNVSTSSLTIKHSRVYHTGLWTCIYKGQRLTAKVIVQKGEPCRRRRHSSYPLFSRSRCVEASTSCGSAVQRFTSTVPLGNSLSLVHCASTLNGKRLA